MLKKCNPSSYPLGLWIKLSFVFSFTTTMLLSLGSFTAGLMTPDTLGQLVISFLVILCVAISNICVHVFFKTENPIKSPVYVKLASFGASIAIVFIFSFIEQFFDITKPKLSEVIIQNPIRHYILLCIQGCLANIVVLLWLYFLMSEYAKVRHQLERAELERSREEAVNLMLRQQIQPHFLFNALATLKSLIRKDALLAERYLLRLSDFLRVAITSVKSGEVASIEQEIRFCTDYLEMQKIRFGDALSYEVNVCTGSLSKFLPIFSIQPLVDNVLKHNSFTVENPVSIRIEENEGWIVVRNNKNLKIHKVESNACGLKNLRERYAPFLQNGVEIIEDDQIFEVKIKIVS